MTRSTKLGLTSVVLLVVEQFMLKPLDGVLGVVLIVISSLLGFIAAREGSRWWILVPVVNTALVVLLVWVVLHIR